MTLSIGKKLVLGALKSASINPTSLAQAIESLKMEFYKRIDGKEPEKLIINIGGTQFFKRDVRILDYAHPDSRHYDLFYFSSPDYNFDLLSEKPLPFSDEAVSFFYSANTFEHLSTSIMPHLYSEIFRCLKPGGAFRIQVPDLSLALDAFVADDREKLMNLDGDIGRFAAMKKLYGAEHAHKVLKGWPEKIPGRKGPYTDQEIVNTLMQVFAAYYIDRVTYDEVMAKATSMTIDEFGSHYANSIPIEWQRKNPHLHAEWHTPERILNWMREAGFEEAYESKPFESNFSEMRGVGKYWGFDLRCVESSCYLECVKH